MNCPKCQAPLGPNARFCAQCGFSLDAKGGNSLILGVGIGVGVVGLAIAALALAGVFRFRGQEEIQAPIVKSAPIEAPIRQSAERMPEDIRNWLDHLRRIEEKRMEMARTQITMLMVSMEEIKGAELGNQLAEILGGDPTEAERTEAPSVSKARDIAANVRPQWQELNIEFEGKAPPEACRTIAADYGQTLRETGATVGDIIEIINNLGTDPQTAVARLREIMNANKKMIDEPAVRADQGVQAICDLYGERKWFSIKGDVGGGGMFTMPGVPGIGGGL